MAIAAACIVAPTLGFPSSDVSTVADGCYNGATVLDPYGSSCTLPGPVGKVRGSAPDANAIIACRHHPGCLAVYVNGP
ncbi:hypothetical protein H7J73_14760 [Mycolicibacterium komossense]|uniref:Secreted protein n=1 Tax=Mycolicibacterium komossense TaxID=1779 RepID=A0ABT3CCT9_9MYCO|nr:hypothetical protein [Mycolicibacterium komossense]MCV7227293.1 hypothetical protein [Mycolicibacterium komossense]